MVQVRLSPQVPDEAASDSSDKDTKDNPAKTITSRTRKNILFLFLREKEKIRFNFSMKPRYHS
jgi:hypothetical protein